MLSSALTRQALLALLLAVTTACTATRQTDIDKHSVDTDANFSQLKTYRWDFSAMSKVQPEGGHLPEFDRVLCEHVDKHMADRGYQRIEKGAADFTLDYRVVITQEEVAQASNGSLDHGQKTNEYGLRWTFDKGQSPTFQGLQAPKDNMVAYQNGTLHLGAFDAQGRIVWHSSATRILSERGNEAERRAALRIAVNKLMKLFPER